MIQTNLKPGPIVRKAAVDLTGKEGFLAKLLSSVTDVTGLAALPTALTDRTPYLIQDGNALGKDVELLPFSADRQYRVAAKGTGSAGNTLSPADPAVPADAGKVRKTPTATGTFAIIFIAEEDFVDGQFVLCRPLRDTITNP